MALSIVYPPKGATTSSAVDIVAVHGLGGDPIETWTHPKSNAFWLKDFLPQQIPDARIMTFGYNAAAAFGQSTSDVTDHAKGLLSSLVDKREESEEKDRPLIFIAHSLGGIVVKQALLQARLEPRYQSIRDVTLGIIFLGTPHRGSEKATYGKVLANVAQIMTHRPSSRLLSALQTNSDVLQRLTTDFRFQLPQYHIASFYEQRPMKIFSGLIVEKHSALLELEHEEQIPIDANHSAMCKFEADSDDTFEKVYKRIRRMRTDPRPRATDQTISYNKHYEVPHLVSPVFTGHGEVCACLDSSLKIAEAPRQPVQRRFVLFGLGGSGKTQICLRYAQMHRERYWGIFWIDASTIDSIQRCFAQIALLLQVDEEIHEVKRVLANTSQSWLLVFDNADDPSLSLAPYFPAGDRGHILITSRNPGCHQYNTVGSKEIGQLSADDSVLLLVKTAYGDTTLADKIYKDGEKVVEVLGCLALAIAQAGAYIRETSCSLKEYFEIYERRQKELLGYLPKHIGTDYGFTVYTTWQVSLDMIESMRDKASNYALELSKLLCFYHHDQFPIKMLYNAWHNSKEDSMAFDSSLWLKEFSDFFEYQQSIRASVTLLASFSLITRDSDALLSFHPLVHDWCRDRMSEIDQQSSCRRAVSLLARSVKWEFKTEDYTFRRSLVSHVHACLRLYDHRNTDFDDNKWQEWLTLALILGENGWTRDALELTEQVVQLRRTKLGEDHPDTLQSMHSLAVRYSEAGRRSEALQLTEQVVQLRRTKLGEDHPDTLQSMHSLAVRYSEAGRRSEALQLTEQVVQLRRTKLGEDHPDTLQSMHSLAVRYSEAGRRSEALQLTEQVVQLRKTKLGEDHPDTLHSMHSLAVWYSEAGRRSEALQLTEQVVQLRKAKLGEDHPDTLQSMHNLAGYSEAGRRSEALQLTEQVVQLRKTKLGEDHPDTLQSMHNLAVRYSEAGRRSEALQLTEQVVQLRKAKLGEDHPDTLHSMHNLAVQYSEAGRRSEALQLTEQVVQLRKTKLGEDHPDTLHSMHSLAVDYSEAGRRSEALQLTEQVVQLRKAKLGEDHPDTLRSMHSLAVRYSEAGRRSEALQLTEQVVQLRKAKLGEDHPDTLQSMHNLAGYSEAGRRSEALQLTEQVVQLRKAKLGEDHPDTLRSMHNLAVRYSEAGRRSEALQLTEQVVQLRKAKLGEDHPDTLHSMHNLAVDYSEAGRRSEALQLTEQVVQLRKIKLGEDHPNTLHSMHSLAVDYSEAGRRSEALQLTEQVVQLRRTKLGEDHPDTLQSMHSLAVRYSEAGRRSEALQLTEQVVQLRKAKLGEDHPDTLRSMHNLAVRFSEAGRRSEALQLTEQVVQLRKAKLGEDHPDTLHSMHNLAVDYSEAGRRSEALQLTEQVVQLRKTKLGEDHPETLRSIELLAYIIGRNSEGSQRQMVARQSGHRFSNLWRLVRL